MVLCNRERVKEFNSQFTVTSDIETKDECSQNLTDADFIDYKSRMDNLSFYEKTDWNACEDLIYITNEEALWQTIVGEIKTPKGALSNSIGQQSYGCLIWELRGEVLDSLTVKDMEYEIIQTCIKYPEVNNVIDIESYVSDKDGALFITLTIDSIYGTFDGHMRIPSALRSDKDWKLASEKFFS